MSRDRVLDLLRRYGWNATSFQVLEPGFSYWFARDGDAVVAYSDSAGCWLAAGAPICSDERLAEVALEFAADAREHDRKAAFFGAADRLVEALRDTSFDWLQVGTQPWWDPRAWPAEPSSQVRRASRKGVRARPVPSSELQHIRPAAEAVIARWLERHAMAEMEFMVDVEPFEHAHERRYFVAEKDGHLKGLLVAVPIYARSGWFFEDLIVDRDAPNGTSDALIDTAMRALGADGAPYVTLGLVALAGLAPETGRRHPLLRLLLLHGYRSLNWLYGFRGLHAFRARLNPQGWEPVYLAAPGRVTPWTVVAVLQAFAGGRLDRFVAETFRRQIARRLQPVPTIFWERGCQFFAIALGPWIAMILTCDPIHWFGARWLAFGWASFDAVVAAALLAIARGLHHNAWWTRPLTRITLGAVLADCWLTTAQALLHNIPSATNWQELLIIATAIAAPNTAALFLAALNLRTSNPIPEPG
jgi:phosphatidylglycerol lysyltransferase